MPLHIKCCDYDTITIALPTAKKDTVFPSSSFQTVHETPLEKPVESRYFDTLEVKTRGVKRRKRRMNERKETPARGKKGTAGEEKNMIICTTRAHARRAVTFSRSVSPPVSNSSKHSSNRKTESQSYYRVKLEKKKNGATRYRNRGRFREACRSKSRLPESLYFLGSPAYRKTLSFQMYIVILSYGVFPTRGSIVHARSIVRYPS